MKKALLAVLVIAVASAITVGAVPAAYAAPAYGNVKVTVTQDYGDAQKVLKYINVERKKAHLSKLKLDKSLTKAAIQRAAEVGVYVPWTSPHMRPNGKKSTTVNSKIVYECCAEGYSTPEDVVAGWMDSPSHRAGILLSSAKSVGIAGVMTGDGFGIWVLEFSNSKASKVEKSKKSVTYSKTVKAKSKYLKSKFFKIVAPNDGVYLVGDSAKLGVIYSSKYNVTLTGISPKSFKWKSSNPKVISVSKSGKISAKALGSAIITGKLKSGPKVTIKKKLLVAETWAPYEYLTGAMY